MLDHRLFYYQQNHCMKDFAWNQVECCPNLNHSNAYFASITLTNRGIQDVNYILTCPSLTKAATKAATKAGLATLDFETAMHKLANALGC